MITKQQYEKALSRIEVLAKQVEEYEEKNFPLPEPSEKDIEVFEREQLGKIKTYKGRKFTGKIFKHSAFYCNECKTITSHAGNIYERSAQDKKDKLGFEGGRIIYECLECYK